MARLIHIIDELKVGGAQSHLVTILRELKARDLYEHEVWGLFEDGPVATSLREMEITVRPLNLRRYFASNRFDLVAGAIQEEIRHRSPDLVEAHLTWSRLLGLWAAWREEVPRRIGFEHGDIYLASFPFRAANFVAQGLAHHIVACSQSLADWVSTTHRVSRSRIKVMHNCVDSTRFQPKRPRLRPDTWPKVDTLFCAVGTLGTGVNKRFDVCVRAVAVARSKGADVGLVICGDGSQRPILEALIDNLMVHDAVQILGMQDDMPKILASCDAFCHAAPFEPFGIACIEAMASGLPAVVPSAGGIAEIVEDGKTGFTYPTLDDRVLAEQMVCIHSDTRLRDRMGKAAREAAISRFSVPHYVDQLLNLYQLESTSTSALPTLA